MTPLDELLAHDWTIPLALLLLGLTVAAICWDIHRVNQAHLNQHRADRKIPASEIRLTGTDYRDPVRPYFYGDRFAARYRRDRAIVETCLTNNEPRAAGTAEALTTKEKNHGRVAH